MAGGDGLLQLAVGEVALAEFDLEVVAHGDAVGDVGLHLRGGAAIGPVSGEEVHALFDVAHLEMGEVEAVEHRLVEG